jgi:hypothetical protein
MFISLISWAIWFALQPFNTLLWSQSHSINRACEGWNTFVPHGNEWRVIDGKPDLSDCFSSQWVGGGWQAFQPALRSRSLLKIEFSPNIANSKHCGRASAVRASLVKPNIDLSVQTNFVFNRTEHDNRLTVFKRREHRPGYFVPQNVGQRPPVIPSQAQQYLVLDFVPPGIRKSKDQWLRCVFTGELTEEIAGNCMSIPRGRASTGRRSGGHTASSEYHLIAQCGDLTAIIEFGVAIRRSAIPGNGDFTLRRVYGD